MEQYEQDEITLKEIFQKISFYFSYLKQKLKILLIAGAVVGLLSAFNAYLQPPIYKEQLTFMMDDSGGGSENKGLKVLGDLFGGKGKNNLEKILRLFESKQIVHRTLFDSIVLDNKNDYLANHVLEQYTVEELVNDYKSMGILYKESWPKRLLKEPDFKFKHGKVDSFSNIENLYLRLVYEHVTGNESAGLPVRLASKLDEDTGIMTLNMESEYSDITLGVLNNIYHHLSGFFIDKSIEKHLKTYKITKAKRDSSLRVLKIAEYNLANFKDNSRNLVTVKGYLKQLQYEREVQILTSMYGGAVRQLEATDFALKNMTPVVQIIDLPRSPVIPKRTSVLSGLIGGFLLGAVSCGIFIVLRKIVLEIMED